MVMNDYMYYDFDPSKATPEEIEQMQFFIDTDRDGKWGPKSQKALDKFKREYERRNASRLYLDNLLSANELRGDMDDAERLGGTTLPKPRTTFNYLPGLQTTGSQYNAKNVLGLDDFSAPDMQPVGNPNSERIAQLEARLAEIAKERKAFDTEEEMGKYKFQYEGDPSTYINVKQNKRTAEATENIRKSNEKATENANLKTIWEGLNNKHDELYWQNAAYKQAFKKAKESNDANGMEEALLGIKRTQAGLNKNDRQMEQVRGRLMKGIGMDEPDVKEEDVDVSSYQNDIGNARNVSLMKRGIGELKNTIKVDNVSITPAQKKANGKAWLQAIAEKEEEVKSSPLSEDIKSDMLLELGGLRDSVTNYLKPQAKGGQGESMTAERCATLSAKELRNLGHKALLGYQKKGFRNKNLDWALANSAGDK